MSTNIGLVGSLGLLAALSAGCVHLRGVEGEARAIEPPVHDEIVIGTLAGPTYHVRITCGRHEPRYTVMTPAGEILGADLLAHEVQHAFPDIDVTEFRAGGLGPIMRAQ